jgi:hypothetical protein
LLPACGGKFLDLVKLSRGDDIGAALLGELFGNSHGSHPQPSGAASVARGLLLKRR